MWTILEAWLAISLLNVILLVCLIQFLIYFNMSHQGKVGNIQFLGYFALTIWSADFPAAWPPSADPRPAGSSLPGAGRTGSCPPPDGSQTLLAGWRAWVGATPIWPLKHPRLLAGLGPGHWGTKVRAQNIPALSHFGAVLAWQMIEPDSPSFGTVWSSTNPALRCILCTIQILVLFQLTLL